MKNNLIPHWHVVDLDCTIANCDHRLKYIIDIKTGNKLPKKEKNYDKFYQNCIDDMPIQKNIHQIKLLIKKNDHLVFITGRPERMRDESWHWLLTHSSFQQPMELFMRAEGDYRPDGIVKSEILLNCIKNMLGTPPKYAFDDRDSVLNAYKKLPELQNTIILDVKKWKM